MVFTGYETDFLVIMSPNAVGEVGFWRLNEENDLYAFG